MDSGVFRRRVFLGNLLRLTHSTTMPSLNAGAEFTSSPLDDILLLVRVLDDPGLVVFAFAATDSVFFEVYASLSDSQDRRIWSTPGQKSGSSRFGIYKIPER